MMKKWKCRLKSVFLAVLTAALVTGGTNYWTLAAMAAGRTGSSDYETAGGENLTADEKRIYNALKSAAKGIAAGKRISTIVNMSGFTSLWNSSEEITEMLDGIMSDLLQDYPGDFYWYGKEYYGEWQEFAGQMNVLCELWFGEGVRQEYGLALELEEFILLRRQENTRLDKTLLPEEKVRLDFYLRNREEEWAAKKRKIYRV